MLARDLVKVKGTDIVSVPPDATLGEAIETLAARNIGAVVVMDGRSLAGILSERDVIKVLNGAPTGFRSTSVAEVMTSDVSTAGPEASVLELLKLMTERRFRHVPIVEDGEVIGLVSIGDAVKARVDEVEGEAAALKSYIAT